MKLIHFVILITYCVGTIKVASEILKRTNCISNGGEICGNWNSLCCNNTSVELPDAYDCWILWPFIKSKIRVCGDGKKPKKEAKTCACPTTTTLSPVNITNTDATSFITIIQEDEHAKTTASGENITVTTSAAST